MSEIFVGALLQVALEKLASGGINFILKHVKKNEEINPTNKEIDPKTLHDLEEKLKSVAALLAEAQPHHIESEAYKVWVAGLQDLAFDLEDFLDELVTDAQLRELHPPDHDDDHSEGTACVQLVRKAKGILTCCSRPTKSFYSRSSGDLPSKIKEMNSRLEDYNFPISKKKGLSEVANMQQLMYYSKEATSQEPMRETTSLLQTKIYGRDDRKNEIIRKLLKEEPSKKNYVVIPIVGKGGIGKTTLAQYSYNDDQIQHHFEFKAWVCVSDKKFDVARVTREIINSATGNNLNLENLDQAQRSLKDKVKDKRSLIVLDDVWTLDPRHWDLLQTPFQCCARGSRVIVTTRDENTARTMTSENLTHSIINLGKLSDNDCWSIFSERLKPNIGDKLDEMKSDIIRKCDGLPLAAKALGGLFIRYVDYSQRRHLLDSNIWTEEGDVLPILRLSYFHLPSHLKHIFAYCSIFPKDYEFNEMELILVWMAQGFLPKFHEESMEVTGHRYFIDLVSTSLFERSPSNNECYVMHDLVHDLSQWAAGDICCWVTDTKDIERVTKRTRHLNLWTNVMDQIDQTVTHQLRTFMSNIEKNEDGLNLEFLDFISRIQCTRSLSLASESIKKLPECIGNLKHLRYLDLKFTNITVLPKSIEKLWNLQTLFLIGCHSLREGINFGFLVNLRHIRFPRNLWEAMPLGMGKLTNLQTWGKMYLGVGHERGSMIRELRNLNQIYGKLNVIGLQKVRAIEDAKEVHLDEKKGVELLHLNWLRDREDEVDDNIESDGEDEVDDNTESNVLEQLKPNSCIKEYVLKGYMGSTLPTWLGDPSFKNIVETKLVNCGKCKCLPPLGQLPSLKKLEVEKLNAWKEWVHESNAGFPLLEVLVIEECESFKGNLPPLLPHLKILRVNSCHEATVSPPNSLNLEELEIKWCKALVSSNEDPLVIRCSRSICLEGIELGFTGLEVGGSCSQKLHIGFCHSLVTINKIPLTVRDVNIAECEKLERVEWEESSTSSASNNNRVSICIQNCDSVVSVSIPLTVERLIIDSCESLESVMCDGQWNLFHSLEATDGYGGGGGQLQLAHLDELNILSCPKFISLPNDVLLPSIRSMAMFSNENQRALPGTMHTFTSDILWIRDCPKIDQLPKGGLPRTLTSLDIVEINITQPIQEWRLDLLTRLCHLKVENIGPSGDSVQEIQYRRFGKRAREDTSCRSTLYLSSTSLSKMSIKGFQELKSINCSTFPKLIDQLSVEKCPNLESLGPNNCLPPELEEVVIKDCPLIQQQCEPDPNGPIVFVEFGRNRYTIS